LQKNESRNQADSSEAWRKAKDSLLPLIYYQIISHTN